MIILLPGVDVLPIEQERSAWWRADCSGGGFLGSEEGVKGG